MKPVQKVIHYILWNQIAFPRENESKQDQVRQQNSPIRPEPIQQMVPIYSFGKAGDQMSDIGAVISFPLHDIGLLPDYFFRRSDQHFTPEDFDLSGSVKPIVIYRSKPIPGAEDHVDDSRAMNYLCQPMAEFDSGLIPASSADAKDLMNMLRSNHEIEVLSVPRDPSVMVKCISAAEQDRHPVCFQQIDHGPIKRDSFPLSHTISARQNRKVRLSKVENNLYGYQ